MTSSFNTPSLEGYLKTDIRALLDTLEDNTLYLVEAAIKKNNIIHKSVLWTGFVESGGYCMLFNNTYSDGQIYTKVDKWCNIFDVYYLKVVEKLKTID